MDAPLPKLRAVDQALDRSMHLQIVPVQLAEDLGRKRPTSTFGIRRVILFTPGAITLSGNPKSQDFSQFNR
jgi:hypothetical protein